MQKIHTHKKYFLGLVALLSAFTACGSNKSGDYVVDETYVHKYGVAVPPTFWKESGKNGAVVSTMANGVVVSRSYQEGVLDGDTSYSFPHSSQIEKIETYRQGDLVKTTNYYFEGTAKSEKEPSDKEGLYTLSSWYLSGTPRSKETYNAELLVSGQYFDINNHKDASVEDSQGTRLIRDDYGHLLATDTIDQGQIALKTTYHPNGAPKEQIPYRNGVIEGSKKTFYPAGEPATIEPWTKGKQHGITLTFQHGEKLSDVPYVNGVKEGKEIRYRDGKTVVQEINWKNGLQHGATTTYVGNTSKVEWFYQGKSTTKSDYDFLSNRPPVKTAT